MTLQPELQTSIESIDLGGNNIFIVNTLKKVRAFYFEEIYKAKSSIELLVSKFDENEDDVSLTETNKEDIEFYKETPEEYLNSISISITEKKILSLVKLSPQLFEQLKATVELFLTQTNGKQAVNIEAIKFYFDTIDTKAIEEGYLSQSLVIEKSKDVISIADMTFNDKVQKIYTTIETLSDQKSVLKQMEVETLESDASWMELLAQKEEIAEAMKQRKIEILSNTSLETKSKEVTKELSEEQKVLLEFLEYSIENGEYKEVSVRNKDGKEMRPQISISLKEVKWNK